MTTTKGTEPRSEPSPGALRAADKVLELIEGARSKVVTEFRPATVKILAKHIDRETGASDLLAALEYVQEAIACWRDNESMPAFGKYKEGELNLEEVLYCVIDPAISKGASK